MCIIFNYLEEENPELVPICPKSSPLLPLPAPLQVAYEIRLPGHFQFKFAGHYPVKELIAQPELRPGCAGSERKTTVPGLGVETS